MKRNLFLVFTLLLFLMIGFATVNIVLDLNGAVTIQENQDDFQIELTGLEIDKKYKYNLISEDKSSFSFTGSNVEYTVTNYSYQYDAVVVLECTPEDDVTIEQINNLEAQSMATKTIKSINSSEITCTINIKKISRVSTAEDMCKSLAGKEWSFDYINDEHSFLTPCEGSYKLETWGAQGGSYDSTYYGGYGTYSTGEITLNDKKILYINVGGTGNSEQLGYADDRLVSGGYNGGGDASGLWTGNTSGYIVQYHISGGGATHIALTSGELKNLSNKINSILIVSSGGGGAEYFIQGSMNITAYCKGGNGGGIEGAQAICEANMPSNYTITSYSNANQTSGGSSSYMNDTLIRGTFGQGGTGYSGGGAGFYGGTGNYKVTGGGSSYIGNSLLKNKAMYCYNCTTSSAESTKTISTTNVSDGPISNYAKILNGYAKITYLGK